MLLWALFAYASPIPLFHLCPSRCDVCLALRVVGVKVKAQAGGLRRGRNNINVLLEADLHPRVVVVVRMMIGQTILLDPAAPRLQGGRMPLLYGLRRSLTVVWSLERLSRL